MKTFFTHYSLHFGISIGFDLTDYDTFVLANEDTYRKTPALTIKLGENITTLTELDMYYLSRGKATEAGRVLIDLALEKSKASENPLTDTLLVSSHSGSSDYLQPFKVLAEYDTYK